MGTPFSNGKHPPSLIERMGGIEAASGILVPAVEIFYAKLLADPELMPFFEGVDNQVIMRKQVEFLAYVFGGPAEYTGKGIAEAHEHLIREKGLNETHFDMVASHFRDTLFEVGAPSELVDEAIVILGTCRPVFEAANRHASRMDSGDLGVVANQIQQLLKSSDHELEETKKKVRKILGNAKPENVVRMRSALRMRSVGLADLFDQAIASGAPAECPIHIDASPSAI